MKSFRIKQIAKQLPKTLWADERKPEYGVLDGKQVNVNFNSGATIEKLVLAIVATKTLDGDIMKVFFTDTKESVLVEGGLEAAMDLIGEHYA